MVASARLKKHAYTKIKVVKIFQTVHIPTWTASSIDTLHTPSFKYSCNSQRELALKYSKSFDLDSGSDSSGEGRGNVKIFTWGGGVLRFLPLSHEKWREQNRSNHGLFSTLLNCFRQHLMQE